MFTDHMVLQKDRDIVIWGSADPGEAISVSLSTGPHTRTVADSNGRWTATLPPMQAGGPFEVTIAGNQDTVVLRDVLIGEVWVLSGQSNMAFELSRASNAEEALKQADRPQVRLLTIPKSDALKAQVGFSGQWAECTAESARGFSAVGYFFGIALAEKLHVPVGLILSSWPGTQAEEWTPVRWLEREPEFDPILSRWQDAPDSAHAAASDGFPFSLETSDIELVRRDGKSDRLSDFHDASAASRFGGGWTFSWQSAPLASWGLRPAANGGFTSAMSGRLRDADGATLHLSLQLGNDALNLDDYTGVRFQMRGAGYFQFQVNEPLVKDGSDYSSTVLKPSAEWQTVDLPFSAFKQPAWGVQRPFTQDAITGFQIVALTGDSDYPQRAPSGLFNGMIAPLVPLAIRGVLWYQGEGNATRAYQYRKLLPALINGWREAWGAPQLPFIVVQLPKYGSVKTEPSESAWAELREAQAMTAAQLRDVDLVITIDLGEPENVHPADKVDVGNRAALIAERSVYGIDVAASGPVIEGVRADGDCAIVQFSHRIGALRGQDGKELHGFAVAGEDRNFHWADARIDGNNLIVCSTAVPRPVAVRYDWADSPDGNLTDDSGLPAGPFRSDDWPGITAGQQ